MKWCVVGLMMMAAVGGAVLADDRSDADVKKLAGAWDVQAIERRGKKIDDVSKGKLSSIVFTKDMKVIGKIAGQTDQPRTYKIDVSKSPKQFDVIGGEKKEKMEGIYEIDGDKLKLGFPRKGPEGKRPTGFDDEEAVILHLKRQKS